jgi:hypothetical protein
MYRELHHVVTSSPLKIMPLMTRSFVEVKELRFSFVINAEALSSALSEELDAPDVLAAHPVKQYNCQYATHKFL